MAERDDIFIRWDLSPRLIYVSAPSTEVVLQDLHDTLRDIEEEPQNLIYPHIVSSAGKENLGGGVSVGITTTLRDAKLAFIGRKTATSTGTVTTADATGRVLTDSTATFISDGVQPGAWVVNFDDESVCSVLTVDSETQITTDLLEGGTLNNFGLNDRYRIQNVTQCNVSGGNLVAVDSLNADIDPILPTVGTQVVRTSSSSATLQELQDIQYSSFGGGVTVDATSIYSGTGYPTGTPRQPVNNLTDALSIATSRGFTRFFILGDITIDAGLNFTGLIFEGESESKSTFTIDPSANTLRCEFQYATIEGTLDGGSLVSDCQINTVNYIDGFMERCILNGPISLSGGGTAHFLDCFSGVPGASTPVIDMAGSGSALALRNYNGGIRLENKSGADAVSIDLNSGQIILDSTVTGGTIVCRGVGKLEDNAGAGVTVVNELITAQSSQFTEYESKVVVDPVNGSAGTEYPLGTGRAPVNNLADAKVIAATYGIGEYLIKGTLVVGAGESLDGLVLFGANQLVDTVVLSPGCSTSNTIFRDMRLTGVVNGGVFVERCAVASVVNIGSDTEPSLFNECILFEGTFAFRNGLTTPQNVQFVQCISGVKSAGGVVIDYNGTTTLSAFRKHNGALTVTNHTSAATSVIEFDNGEIVVDPSCTDGLILLRGVHSYTDNSAGATVDLDGTLYPAEVRNLLNAILGSVV